MLCLCIYVLRIHTLQPPATAIFFSSSHGSSPSICSLLSVCMLPCFRCIYMYVFFTILVYCKKKLLRSWKCTLYRQTYLKNGFWTCSLDELFPLLSVFTEAPLQRTASWGAGHPGLHPRWFCMLLHSSLPSPPPTYLQSYAYLLPRKTVSALL